MRAHSWVRRGGVGVVASAALALGTQCDNGATGVEACRRIEELKCEALRGCPKGSIASDDDVASCKLYYRDQCLFGLADSAEPDDAAIELCLGAIDAASQCKLDELATCAAAPALANAVDATKTTGCAAIYAPEKLEDCGFLRPGGGAGGGHSGGAAGAGAQGGG